MSEHTPEPWTRDGSRIKTQRGVIAEVPRPQDGGVFDCEANARLIAAAPDLLDAVRGFLLGASSETALAELVGEDVVRDARAAIAKATGERK